MGRRDDVGTRQRCQRCRERRERCSCCVGSDSQVHIAAQVKAEISHGKNALCASGSCRKQQEKQTGCFGCVSNGVWQTSQGTCTLSASFCCSFTALGLPQLLTALMYPQLLTALGAVVEITEGGGHSGNFLIAFLLWSQLAEILLQIMGAVVVRFGREVCVVLQKFVANKTIIRKLREKDDYGSGYLMTNLVSVGRHDLWIKVSRNLWL